MFNLDLTILIILLLTTPLLALEKEQLGNDMEQKEIWEIIKGLNRAWIEKATDEFKKFFHPQMISIQPGIAERLVGDAACIDFWTDFARNIDVISYEEKAPLIQIYGNTAVAKYYYDLHYSFQGKKKTMSGRDMMTLVKENR